MTLMQHIHGLVATALGAAALLVTSCSTADVVEPEPATLYKAGFYLTVGDEAPDGSASRAPGDNSQYDPGAGVENYIDILGGDIRFVVLSTDNEYLGLIEGLAITPVDTYESSKRYYVTGGTTADISGGNFKVMVLANWGSYPAAPTIEQAWNARYTFAGGAISKENPIPLYGIREFKVGTLTPDVAANLGTIHLLRAMAKIEVIFDDPKELYSVTDLKLTAYNPAGFCAPYGVDSQDEYVKDSWEADYVGTPSIPTGLTPGRDIDFIPVAGTDSWLLYVPEYNNNLSSVPQALIDIAVTDEVNTYRTQFQLRDPNAPSRPADFLRNVWYKLTVRVGEKVSDVSFVVDVIPYEICDLDPIFGLDRKH